MAPPSGDLAALLGCLQQFRQAQQLRFRTYQELTEGFDLMLDTRQEAAYRETLAQATVAFQVCSETVNAAEADLRNMHMPDIADMLRVLQNNEKEKLRLTLILQALRQGYARGSFSWQDISAVSLTPIAAQVEPDAHSCHRCTSAEPTKEEYTAAKGEALQGLQQAIENINEVLEEIRYAEDDLTGGDTV